MKIVFNKIIGAWFVVRGPHQAPVSGAFNSKSEASAWLASRREQAQDASKIEWEGDVWRVAAVGSVNDGKVYAHLFSTTRFRQQRNGQNPIQMADWLPVELIPSECF